MSVFVYDHTPNPIAKMAYANGQEVPFLDVPDGGVHADEGEIGTDEWDGMSLIFVGGREQALHWLLAALVSVAQLPEDVED